jgi:hypothetical protein
MSLKKLFIYSNKLEANTDDTAKFEAYRAHARNKGWKSVEAEQFPPKGFYLDSSGNLNPKSDAEKVEAGELSLADLIAERCEEVAAICRKKIVNGIVSSALGEPHIYPSDETDQQNLAAKVIADRPDYFKCTNVATGIKDFFPHSVEQFKKAFQDGDTYITAMLKNSSELQKKLRQTTTYLGVKNFNVNTGWTL